MGIKETWACYLPGGRAANNGDKPTSAPSQPTSDAAAKKSELEAGQQPKMALNEKAIRHRHVWGLP